MNPTSSRHRGRWMVAWQVGQFTPDWPIAVAIVGVATAIASQRETRDLLVPGFVAP